MRCLHASCKSQLVSKLVHPHSRSSRHLLCECYLAQLNQALMQRYSHHYADTIMAFVIPILKTINAYSAAKKISKKCTARFWEIS